MRGNRGRSAFRSAVAVLCAACFLAMGLGTVSRASAADDWPVWPKKTVEPGVETKTASAPGANGAANAGDAAGQNAAKGISSGTIGWIAVGVAAAIGIGVAASGGGSSSNH